MAVNRFKVALNNANFPLTSTRAQRAAFIPGLDAAPRTPRIFMGDDVSADYNMSQVIYSENVLPTSSGIKSVGYSQRIPPSANNDFDTIFPLRDAAENVVLYSPSRGKNYIHNATTNLWSTGSTIASIWALTLAAGLDPANSKVTYAYVDGKTFVCYSRLKSTTSVDMSIMQWNSTTQSLAPSTAIITNLPFPAGEIDGISSSSGYLIVWSGLTIAWAPFNGTAFDFTIYSSGSYTGAGYQIPEDIKGPITSIISMAGGFVAFTRRNAIGASYHSQTIQSPWVFREIPNAGGIENYEQCTVEGTLARLQAYTSSGMQEISLNSAELVHPQVSDFITSKEVERYDFASHSIVPGTTSVALFTKITAVGNRYLVISYGYFPGTYSYALVYDMSLKRWGKLRIVHRDCFSYNYQASETGVTYAMMIDVTYADLPTTAYSDATAGGDAIIPAQYAMAFLRPSGEVVMAAWSSEVTTDTAVAIIGRIQLTRGRNTQLNRIEAEGVDSGNIYLQASTDGRTIDRIETTVDVTRVPGFLEVGTLLDCKNFNIIVEGTFDLSTLILEATPTGAF